MSSRIQYYSDLPESGRVDRKKTTPSVSFINLHSGYSKTERWNQRKTKIFKVTARTALAEKKTELQKLRTNKDSKMSNLDLKSYKVFKTGWSWLGGGS